MKKVIIPIVIAICVVVAVVALDPFHVRNGNPGTNYTAPDGGNSSENNNPEEGIVTNPGEEEAKPTFRLTPGKHYIDDEDHHIVVRNPDGTITNEYTIHGAGEYVAGKSRECQLVITNLNDWTANFSVDYRVPDFVEAGYSRPTPEVRDWVWISNRKPTIPAGETFVVTIRLGMPENGVSPSAVEATEKGIEDDGKWEFWIGVFDKSQTGNIQVEQGQRWLITME